jgi:hypothetical protein
MEERKMHAPFARRVGHISLTTLLMTMTTVSSAGDLTGRIDVIAPVSQGVQAQIYIRMTDTAGGAIPSGLPAPAVPISSP